MGLHVKTFVFDREKTFIGSLNLDPRSVYQNTELGVIIDDAEMANEIATLALELLPDVAYRVELDNSGSLMWHGKDYETGESIKLDHEPDAGIFLRFFAFISRILPVESQL
jgi:putative cardiolipin synthase